MRRGHPGKGGWRNDGPRHFRPRGGGPPPFRGRSYPGLLESPRFPHPGPRFQGPGSYNHHNAPEPSSEYRERGGYRGNRNQHHAHDRNQSYPPSQGSRQILPLLQRMRHGETPLQNASNVDHDPYHDARFFEDIEHTRTNAMSDIDMRQPMSRPSPWNNNSLYPQDRNSDKYRHQNDDKIPTDSIGSGHRPPTLDHYGGHHSAAASDCSDTFTRSVDDTVNIVRKRLKSRESHSSESRVLSPDEMLPREPMPGAYTNEHREFPIKKTPTTPHRVRTAKTNCDKIKNKIVHQLFKMDKEKMHKLMDNPSSSSKFEYAISSLITESQNSYNRHLRSAAEKSLYSSSSDFIHNDNNTIYEDTFMKQMQCILEPQDTIVLEDMKPMVLAEICKVLQIDNLEQRHEEEVPTYSKDNESQFKQYPTEYSYDSYNHKNYVEFSPSRTEPYYEQKFQSPYETPKSPNQDNMDYSQNPNDYNSEHLFQRRKSRRSRDRASRKKSTSESDRRGNERKSIDSRLEERCEALAPLFDCNTEQLSEEDDPFAELDKQYHVAVDHSFIDNYDISSPQESFSRPRTPVPDTPVPCDKRTPEKVKEHKVPIKLEMRSPIKVPIKLEMRNPIISVHKIKEEIDSQLQDMAKSPIKFSSFKDTNQNQTLSKDKSEELLHKSPEPTPVTPSKNVDTMCPENKRHQENDIVKKDPETVAIKTDFSNTTSKSSTPPPTRKRSTDQKPSHRKEKRKKSESNQSDNQSNSKQILNKNIIINVNDCAAKSDKCETPKSSIFNLFFSKEKSKESCKDNRKSESIDKNTDKHEKKKESTKKTSKEKDKDDKRYDSSGHSTVSESSSGPTPTKSEVKLKPIDMFEEQPRKGGVHQAHRNTAPAAASTPAAPAKPLIVPKPIVISRKFTKRHIATQVSRKCISKETQTTESKSSTSRFSQTVKKKLITRGSQTDPVSFKTPSKSTDAFERMKEIDIEIQTLLQEKFKLYNSLETQESCTNTMQSLGMAVLNVTPSATDDNDCSSSLCEDDIVDDFTNIPVEDLEQIALETVEEENKLKASKKSHRKKKLTINIEQKAPLSPTTTRRKRNSKPPNISLLEQIITDDRPLEDIISLDDLEAPIKSSRTHSKKSQKVEKPKKKGSKKAHVKSIINMGHGIVKECSVVVVRHDLDKLLKSMIKKRNEKLETVIEIAESDTVDAPINVKEDQPKQLQSKDTANDDSRASEEATEDAVLNDLQFDMLDVSEDIVIGDVCEVKCSEEKDTSDTSNPSISEEIILDNSQSSIEETTEADVECSVECKTYDYAADENLRRDSTTVSGNGDAILAIECVNNDFLAASLDGNVYHYSSDGQLLNTLRGSNLAVTCLTIVKGKDETTVYTGSLDSRIRFYNLEMGIEKGPECNVLSPIQTMDLAWETIFVGTRTGFVLQFECKNNILIPVSTIKFSDQAILALRAIKEGARKVLLVAARSEAVTIKDAQTGLLLRTLEGPKMTVYTLLFEEGKVYCGTSSHQIHVFDYVSGSHTYSHESGKGVVCVRRCGGLLLAGCYDGCVYVYRDGQSRALAQLRGPSLMLLSLAVLPTKIIAGYKDRSLYIWKMPLGILQEMIL